MSLYNLTSNALRKAQTWQGRIRSAEDANRAFSDLLDALLDRGPIRLPGPLMVQRNGGYRVLDVVSDRDWKECWVRVQPTPPDGICDEIGGCCDDDCCDHPHVEHSHPHIHGPHADHFHFHHVDPPHIHTDHPHVHSDPHPHGHGPHLPHGDPHAIHAHTPHAHPHNPHTDPHNPHIVHETHVLLPHTSHYDPHNPHEYPHGHIPPVIRPEEADFGGCCDPATGAPTTLNASGALIVPTGNPCGADDCSVADTSLSFTRDALCLSAVVPVGQGYWIGNCPISGLSGSPKLVVWCDLSSDPGAPARSPTRWKAMLVDPTTGCQLDVLSIVSAQCDPIQIVADVSTSECCKDGDIPTKRITITQ